MSEILVGIDGSDGAQDALVFAQRLAGPTGASLRLASAFPYDNIPSRVSTMRQPKCKLLETLGFWLKITLTSSRREESAASLARASAVLLPILPGSEKQK